MFIIAGLQHHLLTLLHDAAHDRLHSNKSLNNFLADFFCGIPIFNFFRFYKFFHLQHHRFTGQEEKDPELLIYKEIGFKYQFTKKKDLLFMLLKEITGYSTIKSFVVYFKYISQMQNDGRIKKITANEIIYLLIWITLFSLISLMIGFKSLFLLWFFPGLFILPLMIRLHGYGEHLSGYPESILKSTINHNLNLITRFFIYPISSSNHVVHHLYPSIPWYNLSKAKKLFLKNEESKKLLSNQTIDSFFIGRKSLLRLFKEKSH